MVIQSRKEWLWWILATVTGWVTFLLIFEGLSYTLFPSLIISGALIGFGQWRVIRRHIPHAWWWLLASLPGWLLTWSYFQVFQGADFIPPQLFLITGAISGFMGGLLGGILQWLVLRRYFAGAMKWLISSIAGTTIGMVVFWLAIWLWLLILFESVGDASLIFVVSALAGLVHGGITGVGWLWLRRRSNQTPSL